MIFKGILIWGRLHFLKLLKKRQPKNRPNPGFCLDNWRPYSFHHKCRVPKIHFAVEKSWIRYKPSRCFGTPHCLNHGIVTYVLILKWEKIILKLQGRSTITTLFFCQSRLNCVSWTGRGKFENYTSKKNNHSTKRIFLLNMFFTEIKEKKNEKQHVSFNNQGKKS